VSNHCTLTACIAEAQPLRYTPAGLPALDLRLEHESLQREAGSERQVKASVKAIGSSWTFQGFLAMGRGGKGLVFHIQDIQQN
jgi:primosomal replication protein N